MSHPGHEGREERLVIKALGINHEGAYDITSEPGTAVRHGVVRGPFGTISGGPLALTQLADALTNAAALAIYAENLDVDQTGPLPVDEKPMGEMPCALPQGENDDVDLPEPAAAADAANHEFLRTWARAGEEMWPVERSDWHGTDDGATATARIDGRTHLHYDTQTQHLTSRTRCPHNQLHERHITHPTNLEQARREAAQCPGHDGEATR